MNILVTGSAGFICGYLVEELLSHGHVVYGIDNFSKYGKVEKSYDGHPNYHFTEGDVKNLPLLKELAAECDQMLCSAAMIGGISYFHEFAYDLLAENERIIAASFDAAIWAKRHAKLRKINVLSSSMVYESATAFPSHEGDEHRCPPPLSTYGFQKLACEYFAQGAWEQYRRLTAAGAGEGGMFAVVIGSNLGALFTPVGALAGIMWMRMASGTGVRIGFGKFTAVGALVSLPALLAALGALALVL